MDSEGAQELARILAERQARTPAAIRPVQAVDAAPIYHWVGVEPPESDSEDEA